VEPVAEAQVVVDPAVDVEGVGIREVPLVAVRGTVQQQHDAPFRHRLAVVLGIPGDCARLHW
jgi:hypothetical protein